MNTLKIVIEARGGQYQVFFEGEPITRSRTPLLTAARFFLSCGYPAATVLEMYWRRKIGEDLEWSLRAPIGSAAKLTVLENDKEGPYFAKYNPPKIKGEVWK